MTEVAQRELFETLDKLDLAQECEFCSCSMGQSTDHDVYDSLCKDCYEDLSYDQDIYDYWEDEHDPDDVANEELMETLDNLGLT